MKELIEIDLGNNTKIHIESATKYCNYEESLMMPASSSDRIVKKAKSFINESIAKIKGFSEAIAEEIKKSEVSPDELELEFSVQFSADTGIIISSVSTEANVIVKMRWNK